MVTISIELAIDRSSERSGAQRREGPHTALHRDGHAMATPGEDPGCPKLELFLPIFCPDHAFLPTNERKNTYFLCTERNLFLPLKTF